MSQHHFLTDLTFIGSTALGACYGNVRLSENLDFTGGKSFSRDNLSAMAYTLTKNLKEKYDLEVVVKEPIKASKTVDTWKMSITTRLQQKHLPAQHINIGICVASSYEKKPMMLLNPYGVDMGTNGLIVQTQSREEIYTDKLLDFALHSNRIKYRDLWDIVWLHQQGLRPNFHLITYKLQDRKLTKDYFTHLFQQRLNQLSIDKTIAKAFKKEMYRFLPLPIINNHMATDHFWSFVIYHLFNG